MYTLRTYGKYKKRKNNFGNRPILRQVSWNFLVPFINV